MWLSYLVVVIPEPDAHGAAGSGEDRCHGVEMDQHIRNLLQLQLLVHYSLEALGRRRWCSDLTRSPWVRDGKGAMSECRTNIRPIWANALLQRFFSSVACRIILRIQETQTWKALCDGSLGFILGNQAQESREGTTSASESMTGKGRVAYLSVSVEQALHSQAKQTDVLLQLLCTFLEAEKNQIL